MNNIWKEFNTIQRGINTNQRGLMAEGKELYIF